MASHASRDPAPYLASPRGLSWRRATSCASTWLLGLVGLGLVGSSAAGCGSGLRATPWRTELAARFPGAWPAPFDPPPRAAWTRADETLFLQRIGEAELALVGRFRLCSLVTRRTHPVRIVLDFEPEEVLLEGLDGGAALQRPLRLTVASSWPAFAALTPGQLDPLAGRYLLLVRQGAPRRHAVPPGAGWVASLWPITPARSARLRFALYRLDAALLAEARVYYRSLQRQR